MHAHFKTVVALGVGFALSAVSPTLANGTPTPPAAILNPAPVDAETRPTPAISPAELSQKSRVGLETDRLHNDPRWPQFKNCIENTETPEAFNACLRQAFLGVLDANGSPRRK